MVRQGRPQAGRVLAAANRTGDRERDRLCRLRWLKRRNELGRGGGQGRAVACDWGGSSPKGVDGLLHKMALAHPEARSLDRRIVATHRHQTQVLDLPVSRMIAFVPAHSAVSIRSAPARVLLWRVSVIDQSAKPIKAGVSDGEETPSCRPAPRVCPASRWDSNVRFDPPGDFTPMWSGA
jgi:hypothetical protein